MPGSWQTHTAPNTHKVSAQMPAGDALWPAPSAQESPARPSPLEADRAAHLLRAHITALQGGWCTGDATPGAQLVPWSPALSLPYPPLDGKR